jgi:hypothetical protein
MLKGLQGRLLTAILEGAPFPGVDPDGLELTRLIVKKLRFEYIIRGDSELEAWFDRAPAEFTTAFKAYDALVAPRSWFPREEAEKFRAWCAENSFSPGDPRASKGA